MIDINFAAHYKTIPNLSLATFMPPAQCIAVPLHPVVLRHFGPSIDIGFTRPPPQDSTKPFLATFM
jgi:hypothetical protein